jgi:hypothetical protein
MAVRVWSAVGWDRSALAWRLQDQQALARRRTCPGSTYAADSNGRDWRDLRSTSRVTGIDLNISGATGACFLTFQILHAHCICLVKLMLPKFGQGRAVAVKADAAVCTPRDRLPVLCNVVPFGLA